MSHYETLERVASLKGPSVYLTTLLALFDSPAVVAKSQSVRRCSSCKGIGVMNYHYPCVCAVCGGTGFVIRKWSDV